MKGKQVFILALAALVLASLACNFGLSAPELPASPVPVTTEAVESLEQGLDAAAGQLQDGGPVTIVVDETQMTSLVALELQKQEEPVLTDPQVFLRDGQVQLVGNVQQSGFRAPIQVDLAVTVDGNGRLQYEVVSAKVGPLPLPQSILDQLTAQIDSAFASQIGPEAEKIYFESITIAEGKMTVTGQARQ
jgi:uncharacterized protein YpmS